MEKTSKKIFERIRNMQLTAQQKNDLVDVKELFTPKHFTFSEISRHGFPHQPTCLAFDPVQKLIAIGSQCGIIRIFGRSGVDVTLKHENRPSVLKVQFLVNEGAFITLCSDNCIHLWNFRQKRPEIVHSLKFQKEKLTTIHLPFQSKWLYLGTDRGNVHVVAVETFTLSGYVINWNKAIPLSQKTHPGVVMHLSDCPTDESKMLIGYDKGTIVLWDLKAKQADGRYQCDHSIKCITWHFEGKQFICGHSNGSLSTWSTKKFNEPMQCIFPHARQSRQHTVIGDEVPQSAATAAPSSARRERYRPVTCVEWRQQRNGEELIVFSGGTPIDQHAASSSGGACGVTVIRGRSKALLEMQHNVLAVVAMCDSPYQFDPASDPYALAVLMNSDLAVIDLTSPGYPCFENPNPVDLHESPVTCCTYLADCQTDIIPALYSAGAKQKKRIFSEKPWPVKGGESGANPFSYSELIITGHADGSLKFWDSSSVNVQVLYKLKTSKLFERLRSGSGVAGKDAVGGGGETTPPNAGAGNSHHDNSGALDLFAIERVEMCCDSRQLAVAGQAGQVILFKFERQETNWEISTLEICIPSNFTNIEMASEATEPSAAIESSSSSAKRPPSESPNPSTSGANSSATENVKHRNTPRRAELKQQSSISGSDSSLNSNGKENHIYLPVKAKGGAVKQGGGFRAELICLTCWTSASNPETITALGLNSCYNILAFATEKGLVVVDTVHQVCILAIATCDLYGTGIGMVGCADQQALNSVQQNRTSSRMTDAAAEASSPGGSDPNRSEPNSASSSVDSATHQLTRQSAINLLQQQQPPLTPTGKATGPSAGATLNLATQTQSTVAPGGRLKPAAPDRAKSQNSPLLLRRPFVKSQTVASDDFTPTGSGGQGYKSEVQQSRSSSCESLDVSSILDHVKALQFLDSNMSKKNDNFSGPTLWMGTSNGFVLALSLRINFEARSDTLSAAVPTGIIINTECGALLKLAFIDPNGDLLNAPSDSWRDSSKNREKMKNRVLSKTKTCASPTNSSAGDSSASTPAGGTSGVSEAAIASPAPVQTPQISAPVAQLLLAVGERGLRLFSVATRAKLAAAPPPPGVGVGGDASWSLMTGEVVATLDAATGLTPPLVAVLTRWGHVVLFAVPSLRILLDVAPFATHDARISRTLRFSARGRGLYMCSPSEVQKFSLLAETAEQVQQGACLPDLFQAMNMPEPPKQGFFKELFVGSSTSKSFDREELFGESSGKTSRTLATHIPGSVNLDHLRNQSGGAVNEIARARLALNERGEKLGEVEDKTAQMLDNTKAYSERAQTLMNKFKKKKWYQL